VSIRKARKNDYDDIEKLKQEVHKLHVGERPDVYVECNNIMEVKEYQNMLEDCSIRIVIAENEYCDILGYTITKIVEVGENNKVLKPRKVIYIDELCVSESVRRQGIGKKLTEDVIEYGRNINAESMELGVWEFNYNAIEFYESFGMKTRTRRMEIKL